jgi:hypothetical protein
MNPVIPLITVVIRVLQGQARFRPEKFDEMADVPVVVELRLFLVGEDSLLSLQRELVHAFLVFVGEFQLEKGLGGIGRETRHGHDV